MVWMLPLGSEETWLYTWAPQAVLKASPRGRGVGEVRRPWAETPTAKMAAVESCLYILKVVGKKKKDLFLEWINWFCFFEKRLGPGGRIGSWVKKRERRLVRLGFEENVARTGLLETNGCWSKERTVNCLWLRDTKKKRRTKAE